MAKEQPLSTCPHCGARGVKIRDVHQKDGVIFEWFYCGQCGKNHDAPVKKRKYRFGR